MNAEQTTRNLQTIKARNIAAMEKGFSNAEEHRLNSEIKYLFTNIDSLEAEVADLRTKNNNAIYFTCHALMDCHLWFTGEDVDDLFKFEQILENLETAMKKLSDAEYFTDELYKLIKEIKLWHEDENAGLEAIDAATASALKFYMNP